jgi:4-amino-4-deoxy-L-arabinose transferase-like glycosyltransferase
VVSTTLTYALLSCPARAAATVADWAELAERLKPYANWCSRTIMHLAMHDALNASRPRCARYAPPAPDEPPGAAPEAALAAAAGTVLAALTPGG